MDREPTKQGKLEVKVESQSMHFGYSVPVEIRDSNMRLVEQSTRARQFNLSPGLYQVSAVLEDGREHRELVEIKKDATAKIQLSAAEPPSPPTQQQQPAGEMPLAVGPQTGGLAISSYNVEPRYTQRADSPPQQNMSSQSARESKLVGVTGAKLLRETPGQWIFGSAGPIDAVPSATVRVANRETTISLPTSPQSSDDTCAVRVDYKEHSSRVTAWITPERIVANALMNMLASRQVRSAVQMAEEATELLRQKYSDPTGAALGALILHKVGRLERLESWVRNLAQDFPWLADGKILVASINFERRSNMDEVRALAIDASKRRPLFTDCYAILLDVLRRWPRDGDGEWRRQALEALTVHSPFVDWDSICFSLSRGT